MKKTIIALGIIVSMISCKKEAKDETPVHSPEKVELEIKEVTLDKDEATTHFSKAALKEEIVALDGTKTTIGAVLKGLKGKTIVLDVWASWCGDCMGGLPNFQKLQKQTENIPDLEYVFFSVDRKDSAWKKTVSAKNIEGRHYFLPLGMKKSIFGKNITLDWIPRYMVIGKDGEIKLHRAIKATDENILKAINADK